MSSELAGAKILIAEDSRSLRNMMREAFVLDGYEILEGQDGEQALALAQATTPDLVITDVHMPGMDGLTLVRSLRALPALKFTPVLVLTTEWGEEMKQRGLAAGATGWIVKPFHPEQLRRLVARLLSKRMAAR
ncbi:MAG TPA: response regulator [Methylomirabilota bacterium]|nr:response regulator [Methylomirabilota bacterium]